MRKLFIIIVCALLAATLSWFLRPALHEFFFARRTRVRKEMLSAVFNLRTSRDRVASTRVRYNAVPKDIATRRAAVMALCREECETTMAEAQRRAAAIVESARRQGEEAHARALRRVRAQLVERAVAIATDKLAKEAGAPAMRRYLEAGLAAMPEAVAGRGDA